MAQTNLPPGRRKALRHRQKGPRRAEAFIASVEQCADRGAPPIDAKCPPREQDALYAPDLDDGVMINSAALWPLLAPQWKEPKKWWKELSEAKGKKDYDWSHLAMRYWPAPRGRQMQEGSLARRRPWLLLALSPGPSVGLGATLAGRDWRDFPH